MHPNVSECIRNGLNGFKQVQKLRKTRDNVEKFRDNVENVPESDVDVDVDVDVESWCHHGATLRAIRRESQTLQAIG